MTSPPIEYRYTVRFGNVIMIHRPRCPILRRWPDAPARWADGDPEELAERLFGDAYYTLLFCKMCRAWRLWGDKYRRWWEEAQP